MKQTILSVVLVLCLCISSGSAVYAWQGEPLVEEDVFTAGDASAPVARDSVVPTPTEVYKAMIALKDQDAYKEGTPWTNDEPYSAAKGYYHWKGGTLGGANISAVGCVAFAFILSDAAFGGLPARMYAAGAFTYEDIKVGDILRVNNDAHTVIVLEVADVGVVVAEGNISTGDHKGKVHWGRSISKEEVMRSTSHYITRYPEGYVSPDDPTANDIIGRGSLDGGLAWNLTKAGTLTITGRGAMPDFGGIAEQPWYSNGGRIRKVVIGDGVTSIGSCAFWGCGVLGAQISASVTKIGNYAFYGSSVISVTIPSSVKTIGDSAFYGCESLSAVTVSNGVETIGQNAFRACTGLTSIALPASITQVGHAAFFECSAMTSATFAPGGSQVKLGDNLFTRCYYLTRVTLPKRADCIGNEMFMNCGMLAGVEVPQGVVRIGERAFASCSGFTTIIIPDSVTTIATAAFRACPLKKIYFTGSQEQWNKVSKIGDTASVLATVEMHYNYTPPVTPDPGDSGDNSGDNTGSGGSPGSGDNTGNGGGTGSGGGSGSTGEGGSPGSGDSGAGSGGSGPAPSKPAKGTVLKSGGNSYKVTKAGSTVSFRKASGKASSLSIPATVRIGGITYKVTAIEAKAFLNNRKLTKVTIGKNVTSVGKYAFKGCSRLTKVTIGKNVTSIGDGAFSGCKKLTKITLEAKVKKIGKEAFKGCQKLGTITVKSKKITTVGKNAFKGIKSNAKIKVPASKYRKYQTLFKGKGQGKNVKIVKMK